MPQSRRTVPERPCRITVYGPTAPFGAKDRAACLIQGAPQDNVPSGLNYQPAPHGVRAHTLYRNGGRPRWLDLGSRGGGVYLSPSLFVVDEEGTTRALPLASERWAVSADGSRAAFAFGCYDGEDHEFTPAWGYINCELQLWDVPAASRIASADLEDVPLAVAFAGENVLIRCEYGSNLVWEPGGRLREPTPDEHKLPISGPARADSKGDWSDLQMALPGGARIPIIQPAVSTALPMAEGRLFVFGFYGGQSEDLPLENRPFWLNDRGSGPIPATPDEWSAVMAVDSATVPLLWSPSAACFVTGPHEERRVVERGSGRTLLMPTSPWVQAITDDGSRAVIYLADPRGYSVVSQGGKRTSLATGKPPKFAFSRAGDRLFAMEDLCPENGSPCRCYDPETGEVLWETLLPTGPRALTGDAVWSADDREIIVGVQGALLALGRADGEIRGKVTLAGVLPYPLAAPGDAVIVRAEGLFLAVQ